MRNRKRLVSILAGVMAAIMLLSLILSLIPTRVRAASSSEIKKQIAQLKEDKKELEAQMKEVKQETKENENEIANLVDQKDAIDQEIFLLYEQIENINQQLSAYSLLIADKQDELDEAQYHLRELSEKNKARIRAMEEDGEITYWSVLFKASDFSDFLDRLSMIEEIAASDRRRLEEMDSAATEVAVDGRKLSYRIECFDSQNNSIGTADHDRFVVNAEKFMKKVTVCASRVYDILIERGLIKSIGKLLSDAKISPCRAAILTDDNVDPLYSKTVEASLEAAGFSTICCGVPKNVGFFLRKSTADSRCLNGKAVL